MISYVDDERTQLEALYRRYLDRCNQHRFGELDEFVHPDVAVNGAAVGLQTYAEGLAAVAEVVPDYHWDLRHLLIDGTWLSAHLAGAGTSPAGYPVTMPEFALYRVEAGRFVEVWGDLDRTRLIR
jgi:predicted ester cyclase